MAVHQVMRRGFARTTSDRIERRSGTSLVRPVMAIIALALPTITAAQSTPDRPLPMPEPYTLDSGPRTNPTSQSAVVWQDVVHLPDTTSLRLFFGETRLPKDSAVRLTSTRDGETQVLDARELAQWQHSSAYFNGDTIVVELIVAAGAVARVRVKEVSAAPSPAGASIPANASHGGCGLCGPDDREPSNNRWSARMLPAGCTAVVYNEQSCMVTAGHCAEIPVLHVVQFNVPASSATCTLNNPPINDQFPVISSIYDANGPGNDWAAMQTGTNNAGQTIYERYGELRRIASTPPDVDDIVDVHGYGVDNECLRTQTLQVDTGPITLVSRERIEFAADIDNGNSGSALLRDGEVWGIVTHCPCPNIAQPMDHPGFVAAREAVCVAAAANDDCVDAIPFNGGDGDGVVPFSTVGATTDGPTNPDGTCNDFGETQTHQDLWYDYVATCTGVLTITTCDDLHDAGVPTYDTDLVVYGPIAASASFDCAALPFLACNDDDTMNACGTDPDGPFSSTIEIDVVQGEQYLVRIGGWSAGDAGSGVLSITCVGESTGACCLVDGSCEDVDANACAAAGGVFKGLGTTCELADCPPATGACCTTAGCVVLTPTNCGFAGGVYLGAGTPCGPTTCLIVGACCLPDGSCLADVEERACVKSMGGTWAGEGVPCGMRHHHAGVPGGLRASRRQWHGESG